MNTHYIAEYGLAGLLLVAVILGFLVTYKAWRQNHDLLELCVFLFINAVELGAFLVVLSTIPTL